MLEGMASRPAEQERKARLAAQRKALPDGPGVYVFRDVNRTVIYVGKAKSIRKRVANHFTNPVTRGAVEMVDVIDDMEFVLVSSETEALLVENGFIKQYQPQFNIRLRDDKSYPYVCVTLSEDYPRVYMTRERHKPGYRYFGPYSNAKRVRNTLDLLGRLFQYRTCEGKEPGRRSGSPCLDYHIERCTAPCVGYVSRAEYRDSIEGVMAFLAGRYREIEHEIEEQMQVAAKAQDYERAARERDRLQAVRSLLERQRVMSDSIGTLDAIAVTVDGDDANAQVFQVRDGSLTDRQSFYLTGVAGEATAAREGTGRTPPAARPRSSPRSSSSSCSATTRGRPSRRRCWSRTRSRSTRRWRPRSASCAAGGSRSSRPSAATAGGSSTWPAATPSWRSGRNGSRPSAAASSGSRRSATSSARSSSTGSRCGSSATTSRT